jgi:hypothetical protein
MNIHKEGLSSEPKPMARFPEDMTEQFTVIRNGKELEVCVVCGAVTNVEHSTPINQRKGYTEAGQTCERCRIRCRIC